MKNLIRLIGLLLLILSNGLSSCRKGEVPSLTTAEVTNITGTTASSGGTITDEGTSKVIKRGVCWSTGTSPGIDGHKTSNGEDTGTFVSKMFGLNGTTAYNVRAYAVNKAGTGYGNEISFQTAPNTIHFSEWITYGKVSDQESNVYKTVKIGEQTWMAENLRTTHYRDGSPIPDVTDLDVWRGLNDGAYCLYNNDTTNKNAYGALYNWYAVADQRKICPSGWHVPSDADWTILATYLGGSNIAGYRIKEEGQGHWADQSTGASNESGLTALPSGSRYWFYKDDFLGMGEYCLWWSSSEDSSDNQSAWLRFLYSFNTEIVRRSYWKIAGFSVRCIMD